MAEPALSREAGWAGGLTHADALENACEHVAEAPSHRPWVRADSWPLPPEWTYGWDCASCNGKAQP